jgi:hypothetical protein
MRVFSFLCLVALIAVGQVGASDEYDDPQTCEFTKSRLPLFLSLYTYKNSSVTNKLQGPTGR